MRALEAIPGDLIYVSDMRWWLGGLRSIRGKAGPPLDSPDGLELSPADYVRSGLIPGQPVRVEKLM